MSEILTDRLIIFGTTIAIAAIAERYLERSCDRFNYKGFLLTENLNCRGFRHDF
ncbi:MAG: hypothetical protein SAL07_11405 [Oscillatoria sp. PMC 1051.18]|nr:hypothetical protein [Oscillatoria sp. PMC 1051.18]